VPHIASKKRSNIRQQYRLARFLPPATRTSTQFISMGRLDARYLLPGYHLKPLSLTGSFYIPSHLYYYGPEISGCKQHGDGVLTVVSNVKRQFTR